MTTYTVTLALTTNDDCESINEAVDYWQAHAQYGSGISVVVVNDDTGEESEITL